MKGLEGKYLIITEDYTDSEVGVWSGWRDLNSRHPAPKAGALPDCATPRKEDLDPFSVKHFETNIFFCKCFTAVRTTFDNLWCREGEVNPHQITLGKFLHLVMIDITRFFLILFLIQPINFYQILNRKPHQIGNLVTVLVEIEM